MSKHFQNGEIFVEYQAAKTKPTDIQFNDKGFGSDEYERKQLIFCQLRRMRILNIISYQCILK